MRCTVVHATAHGNQRTLDYVYVILLCAGECEYLLSREKRRRPLPLSLSFGFHLFSFFSLANWYMFFHFTYKNKKNVYIEIKLEHFFGHFTSFHTFLSLSSLLHCKRKLLTVRISQNIFEHLDKANSILSCFVLIFCSVILIRQNA